MKCPVYVWPILDSKEKREQIGSILESCGRIHNKIEVRMTRLGMRNYLLQIYAKENWIGNLRNRFRQMDRYAEERYQEGSSLVTYIFECNTQENMQTAQERIMECCGEDGAYLQITSSEREAESLLQLLENGSNRMLLNYYEPDLYRAFTKNLDKMKNWGEKCGISPEDYLVVSDAVRALYNIEPFPGISWIPVGRENRQLERLNQREYGEILDEVMEEIQKSENQVTFLGFRFISLEMLRKLSVKKKGYF